MSETQLEASMTVRTIEADGHILVTVDGSFDAQTFRIPTDDATLFIGGGTYDCRAIVFRSDRAGGRLRALYPWTHGELQVCHRLRNLRKDSSEQTVAEIRRVDDPMDDQTLENRWTTVWKTTDEAEEDINADD